MKSLLVVACLGALLAGSGAYPVVRDLVLPGRLVTAPGIGIGLNYKITIPMAMRLCGFNARCLLNQDIVGIQDREVQQEYETLIRLAVLRELIGLANRRPQDSSEEVPESPEDPPTDAEEVPEAPQLPQDPDTSDSDDRTPDIRRVGVGMIAIGNGLGTRRIIIFRHVANDESPEDVDTAGVGTDDDNVDTAVDTAQLPPSSDDVSPTPEEVTPEDVTPAQPNEVPEDRVSSNTTPAPASGTTDLTNSIEQDGPRSTTQSNEESRESLGDSKENSDQVEVFDPARPERSDPAKPERFADWEKKFKYITPTNPPQIRQI